MYLITVLGNLLILLAVSSDSHLHIPMYFFLTILSLVDICFTSTTIPKMLVNIQTQSKVITYAGCITQMYFFLLFATLDNFLLTVMAYDRFVAICHPLHYTVIMNPRLCGLLVLVSFIMIVSLFYGTLLGVYFSSAGTHSSQSSATASVMYTVVTPMLNPFIYSLRNRDIKGALKRFFGWRILHKPPDPGLPQLHSHQPSQPATQPGSVQALGTQDLRSPSPTLLACGPAVDVWVLAAGMTRGLAGIEGIQSQKETMQCLYDHLAFYLETVRSLEADNWRWESKFQKHLEKKGPQNRQRLGGIISRPSRT
ncbi:olfactory receptor 7D4-like [Phyllostomus hastatus]|uniref:olfactory receptor 7D4-like n=1 Tax=Phyllostomus hastatus TaxID=9423 RepID=UPI001E681E0A|nr:olfactory receptor 7D4-like [Phyllostomus hastatus]